MRVISVNVGRPRPVFEDGEVIQTAIFKKPVEGPVQARALGLDGDGQADRNAHGGPDKAVYAYPLAHYAYWSDALGRTDLGHGVFGENLTVDGLDEATLGIGDLVRVGGALLSPTQPRVPCSKLALRLGEAPTFVKRFLVSERLGAYFRVIEEGPVAAGDAVTVESRSPAGVTVLDVIRAQRQGRKNAEALRHALSADGLSAEWRGNFERLLASAS